LCGLTSFRKKTMSRENDMDVTSDSDNSEKISKSESDSDELNKIGASESNYSDKKFRKAFLYKEKGNGRVKVGDFEAAKKHYKRGIKIVDILPQDEQVNGLKLTLNLNLSLTQTKLMEYNEAIKSSDVVLKIDSKNVKGLFRRGMAKSSLGFFEEAKVDLAEVIKLDPKNSIARKEIAVLKRKILEQKKTEKANFGGIFSRTGSMYDDKEKEREHKKSLESLRMQQEETDWKQSNEDRMSIGLGAQTKDEWLEDKKVEGKKKETSSPHHHQSKAKSEISQRRGEENVSDEDDHLDEEDLKIISETKKKGYCYFRRDLDESEKALLEKEQNKLRETNFSPTMQSGSKGVVSNSVSQAHKEAPGVVSGSEWNKGGTWEEMDKTNWVKERLEKLFLGISARTGKDLKDEPEALMREMESAMETENAFNSDNVAKVMARLAVISATVYRIEKIEGDASIVVVRGKKRILFDFNITLKWKIKIDESFGELESSVDGREKKIKEYKGSLKLCDITAADAEKGRFENEPELTISKFDFRTSGLNSTMRGWMRCLDC